MTIDIFMKTLLFDVESSGVAERKTDFLKLNWLENVWEKLHE